MSPLQPFFDSTTGDPRKLVRMLGWQDADGIPQLDPNALFPFLGYGGALTPEVATIPAQKIQRTAMRTRDLDSKLNFTGQQFDMGDLDPANIGQAMLMLQLMQGYDVDVSGAHHRFRFSQQQSVDGTPWNKKLTYLNDTDKGIPARFTDLIVKGFTLTLANGQNANLTFDVRNGKMDYWEPGVVTGTGVVAPILRHYYTGNWTADGVDSDAIITIVSDTATTVTFTYQTGAGGTPSANQTATKGVWTYIWTGSPATAPLGKRRQQIQVYFPEGADGSFVDDDVWTFANRMEAGLGVEDDDYAVQHPIAEVQCRFILNGEEFFVDNGVTVTVDVADVVNRYAVGQEQPVATDRKGEQVVTVEINRRLVDLELQKRLLNREDASLVIECVSDDPIGATAAYYGVIFVMPLLTLSGPAHDAESGATNYDETITLMAAKPSSNFTYGSITDIAADLELIWDTAITTAELTGA